MITVERVWYGLDWYWRNKFIGSLGRRWLTIKIGEVSEAALSINPTGYECVTLEFGFGARSYYSNLYIDGELVQLEPIRGSWKVRHKSSFNYWQVIAIIREIRKRRAERPIAVIYTHAVA